MKLSDGLKRLQQLAPADMSANGTAPEPDAADPAIDAALPPFALIVPLAAVVVGVALVQRRRTDVAVTKPLHAARGVAASLRRQQRKPRNRMRFYAIGLLIGMLERDTTRRALISALKLAQKRA